MSREFGLLDKSGFKWEYYKGASFRSAYDISNHWNAQKKGSLWSRPPNPFKTKSKTITEKYRATSVQQSTNVFNI